MLSKVTPTLVTDLGYKIFLMFATINIGGMGVFALCVSLLGLSLACMHYVLTTSISPHSTYVYAAL